MKKAAIFVPFSLEMATKVSPHVETYKDVPSSPGRPESWKCLNSYKSSPTHRERVSISISLRNTTLEHPYDEIRCQEQQQYGGQGWLFRCTVVFSLETVGL